MTSELRSYAVTIPSGTLASAPYTATLAMPSRIVTAVRWRVPPGPRGSVGWALSVSGGHVIPWGDTNWIVADDESDTVPMTNAPESGDWSLTGYNTGLLPHTVYLQFQLEPVSSRGIAAASAPLDIIAPS